MARLRQSPRTSPDCDRAITALRVHSQRNPDPLLDAHVHLPRRGAIVRSSRRSELRGYPWVGITCYHIGGGLMASKNTSSSKLGSHIILGGLLAQIIIFGFFIVVSVVFHLRLRAMPNSQSHDLSGIHQTSQNGQEKL
jgi:hypothetical protein